MDRLIYQLALEEGIDFDYVGSSTTAAEEIKACNDVLMGILAQVADVVHSRTNE